MAKMEVDVNHSFRKLELGRKPPNCTVDEICFAEGGDPADSTSAYGFIGK
ncbi:hypothetical protein SAMN05421858_4919 [Haladaptatus litoreus]|uniref:Uncharacterized protein n=1 Tax=Haladaptatus litoreus TaxID=553468 RepID=A0A1N7FBW6_9EURY|nr:hypothetical protein SAMN05421858_4919 [Haladaptatus litoreus]